MEPHMLPEVRRLRVTPSASVTNVWLQTLVSPAVDQQSTSTVQHLQNEEFNKFLLPRCTSPVHIHHN